MLLHAHGLEGEHFHVVPAQAREAHDHHALHAELELTADHHGQRAERHPGRSDAPAAPVEPQGEGSSLLISLPGELLVTSLSPKPLLRPACSVVLGCVSEPRVRSRVDAPAIAGVGPPGRARAGKERSGVAAVLSTSCAVLL